VVCFDFGLKKAGITGAVYAITSMILAGLPAANQLFSPYWFVPNLLFLAFLVLLNSEIQHCHIPTEKPKKKRFKLLPYLTRYLLFMAISVIFAFLVSMVIHEVGHAVAAKAYKCEGIRAVIYDVYWQSPYTELQCPANTNQAVIDLSGLLLTAIFALVFMATKERFLYASGILFFGFSMLGSYSDFLSIGVSESLVAAAIFVSAILVVYGITLLDKVFEADKHQEVDEVEEVKAVVDVQHYKDQLFYWGEIILHSKQFTMERLKQLKEEDLPTSALQEFLKSEKFLAQLAQINLNLMEIPHDLVHLHLEMSRLVNRYKNVLSELQRESFKDRKKAAHDLDDLIKKLKKLLEEVAS
jgi:hypothetical protein